MRLSLMGTTAGVKSCACWELTSPVVCDNGETTYLNQCVADCAEAKGCQQLFPSKSHFCPSCNGIKVLLSLGDRQWIVIPHMFSRVHWELDSRHETVGTKAVRTCYDTFSLLQLSLY